MAMDFTFLCIIFITSTHLLPTFSIGNGKPIRNINHLLMEKARKSKLQFLKSRSSDIEVDFFLNIHHTENDTTIRSDTLVKSSAMNYKDQIQQKVYNFYLQITLDIKIKVNCVVLNPYHIPCTSWINSSILISINNAYRTIQLFHLKDTTYLNQSIVV